MERLEKPSEVTAELDSRPRDEALHWLVDWLNRRDNILDQIKVDDIASALETIAAELRKEAAEQSSTESAGLELAATVLADSAEGVRVGDELTTGIDVGGLVDRGLDEQQPAVEEPQHPEG
ncbi:MAG TPA: hypothetical protein VIT41_02430 [Microlunatus sp.]